MVEEDIEWYNNEYEQLMVELNEYLVDKMQDPSHLWDQAERYELDLQIEQIALEMQYLAMDDNSQVVNDQGTIRTVSK